MASKMDSPERMQPPLELMRTVRVGVPALENPSIMPLIRSARSGLISSKISIVFRVVGFITTSFRLIVQLQQKIFEFRRLSAIVEHFQITENKIA